MAQQELHRLTLELERSQVAAVDGIFLSNLPGFFGFWGGGPKKHVLGDDFFFEIYMI